MGSSFSRKVILEIRVPRESEISPEAMAACFSALSNIKSSLFEKILKKEKPLVFEIASYEQAIHFYAVLPEEYQTYFESQLSAQYPKATIMASSDYLSSWILGGQAISVAQLKLSFPFYFPLKTYLDFKEIDPLSSVLGAMSRAEKEERLLVQVVLLPAGKKWQTTAALVLRRGVVLPDGKISSHPQEKLIEQKISHPGFRTAVRILVSSPQKERSSTLLYHLAGSFGGMALGEGNSFSLVKPLFWQEKKFIRSIIERKPDFMPKNQILNVFEIATLYHLPGASLSGIKNISWGARLFGEPPENLPISSNLTSEEEKKKINFFARTEFKNKMVNFGIRKEDRRRHMYIIGKTGTGKTTLIANMAINDMRNGEGLAVVDPHGDLSEILLDFVPSFRLNDVCFLDPSDRFHPFYLNPLEVRDPHYRELVASGIVAIFYKLYSYSWGPRLEYILRNAILTLLSKPNSTLVEIPELLTNRAFRKKIVERINDRILKNFWEKEFDQMSEKLQTEAISPILNKVGQFVSSPLIREIIGHPRSTLNLEEMMNKGKILILNLSQGKIGEDNAALLGAMFITKMQLAAMGRVGIPEAERRDFYLYVDEFQNFATSSFVKILSEARKYRLNLILANQYIAQVPEEVQKAIFGNCGTLISFLVGAEDSQVLAREFGGVYKEEELVGLGNYQIVIKLAIENLTSRPFYAFTLPLPQCRNQNREKVLRLSREKYTKSLGKII